MRRSAPLLILVLLVVAGCRPAPFTFAPLTFTTVTPSTPTGPTTTIPAPTTTTTLYVSPSGSDSASGAASAPLRSVAQAVRQAKQGSAIVVAGGRYHESIQVYAKEVHISAAPGASVVFDGSVPVNGWAPSAGVWAHQWTPVPAVRSSAPVSPLNPVAGYPDQLFVDGKAQRQVLSRTEVVAGTFFHDRGVGELLMGTDPTDRTVEVSDLSWALYFNRADGSSLSGVTVRRYATEAGHMAAIRAYGNNIDIRSVVVTQNAYIGISAIGNDTVITKSSVEENGYIGIHAHQSRRLTVRQNRVVGNNVAGFDSSHSAGGIKITETADTTVDQNYVASNDGPGIWTDITSSSIMVSNNLIERNGRSGIQIELTGHAIVAGNVAVDNGEAGIWILESNDIQVWNNAAFRNVREIWIEEGPRSSSSSTLEALWDLQRVQVRNNVLGQGSWGSPALLNVDDWTGKRSGASMQVTSDDNAFWLPSNGSTTKIVRWAMWPSPLALSATLNQQANATGQDSHSFLSTASANPFVRNEREADYRMPSTAALAASPPKDVAAALGVTEGTAIAPGPTAALSR